MERMVLTFGEGSIIDIRSNPGGVILKSLSFYIN